MADDLDQLANREGWTVEGRVATFQPVEGGWIAKVRPAREPGKAYDRWHVAIINPQGVATFTVFAVNVPEARRQAEGRIRAKHP